MSEGVATAASSPSFSAEPTSFGGADCRVDPINFGGAYFLSATYTSDSTGTPLGFDLDEFGPVALHINLRFAGETLQYPDRTYSLKMTVASPMHFNIVQFQQALSFRAV